MGCSHNFVYTQGYFVCTKCGKRSYGRSHKKSQGKKIGVGVGIGILLLAVIFAAYSGIFQINQNNLESALENIPTKIPNVDIDLPNIQQLDEVGKIVPKIDQEIPKIQEATKQVIKSELNVSIIESLIHQKINQERTSKGLQPLSLNTKLTQAAKNHSADMAQRNYFEHDSPDGKDFTYRYQKVGFSCNNQVGNIIYGGGENIAQNWTYSSITYLNGIPIYDWNTEEEIAQQTVEGWMESPGHRKNILTSQFRSEGIGVVVGTDDKVLITQNFC